MPFETCRHVKEDGVYCGSPALRDRKYCYYHLMQRGRRLRRVLAQSRNEPCQLNIPPLEDLRSVRVALSEVVQALASGQLDRHSAGLMLYAIQQATSVSLRLIQLEAQMEAAQEDSREVPRDAAREEAVADDSLRLQEYPDFERNFNIQPGIDLDAETDHVMREAELQVAVLSIVPAPQPAAGCPVPAKIHYTREEAYQVLQWQIHRMKQQIREFEDERKREFRKMQPASATPPPAGPLSSSA
jgi:hypothetical protein